MFNININNKKLIMKKTRLERSKRNYLLIIELNENFHQGLKRKQW